MKLMLLSVPRGQMTVGLQYAGQVTCHYLVGGVDAVWQVQQAC